ncbi:hypothetical protein [Sporosarcina sp. A2]|uniref:hypothetical protein n=1 Tax=Sporosarcina sp. A2 TaxID=3393449 RepID=UPI003D7A817E
METFKGLSDEKFLEFALFLQEQFNCALEDVESAEWRVSFFTKAFESCETGEEFTFKRHHTGKPFTFDPNGEDIEGITHMLVEAEGDLIEGQKLLNLLSAFKTTFDNGNN